MPFPSNIRLLIVSFRSAASYFECCLFLAPITLIIPRVPPFAMHAILSSLTFSSADSDSNLANLPSHCLEWPITATSLEQHQVQPPAPITIYLATPEFFPAKPTHVKVARYESLLCSAGTAVL